MLDTIEDPSDDRLLLRGRVGKAKNSGFHVFESPSGDVILNITAASILKLCDGTRTQQQIGRSLARTQPGQTFAQYVREFLNAAMQRGWVCRLEYSHNWRYRVSGEIPDDGRTP